MRARHRHFNPRFAGADLVLDARYINQSDNTAVSTWEDRSGNAYNATQATSSNQPTFRTSQSGGSNGVDFDGGDQLRGTFNPTSVPRSVAVVFQSDVTDVRNLFQVPIRPNVNGWIARWGIEASNHFISGDISTTNQSLSSSQSNATSAIIGSWSSASNRNVSFWRDGNSVTVNGNPPSTIGTPTTNGFIVGAINTSINTTIQSFDGRIFSVLVWDAEQTSDSLRKRCEHASAFSFKIPCS